MTRAALSPPPFPAAVPTGSANAATLPSGEPAPAMPQPVVVIGCGPRGTPLPPDHAAALDRAQVLAGGKRLLDAFPDHPGQRILIAPPLETTLDAIAQCRARGLRVAVLADGDPLFFGIGAQLAAAFGPEALRVLPAASSLQEAAARLALPWQAMRSVSLHGRDDFRPLTAALRDTRQTGGPVCVLADARNTAGTIARFLLARGVRGLRLHAFADMGSPAERHAAFDLPPGGRDDSLPAPTDSAGRLRELDALGGNCTVLLLPLAAEGRPVSPPPPPPVLGIADSDFAVQARLITKWPVRAAGLAALRIAPGHTVWDLGAGSGAVAVEAAALARHGLVVAVERDPARVALIEENRRRFHAPNLLVVHGTLPHCLDDLPDPDRVCIGGGLGGRGSGGHEDPDAWGASPDGPPPPGLRDLPDLPDRHGDPVLDAVCRRLPPGGRLVAHCVLLGTLERVRAALARHGWPAEVTCIQASEAVPLLGDLRLAAMNPVFIVAATRPGDDAA